MLTCAGLRRNHLLPLRRHRPRLRPPLHLQDLRHSRKIVLLGCDPRDPLARRHKHLRANVCE